MPALDTVQSGQAQGTEDGMARSRSAHCTAAGAVPKKAEDRFQNRIIPLTKPTEVSPGHLALPSLSRRTFSSSPGSAQWPLPVSRSDSALPNFRSAETQRGPTRWQGLPVPAMLDRRTEKMSCRPGQWARSGGHAEHPRGAGPANALGSLQSSPGQFCAGHSPLPGEPAHLLQGGG